MCVLFIILKKLAAATTGVLGAMTGFYMVRKQLYLKNDRNYKLLSGVYAVSCCGQSTFFSMFFHIFAIFLPYLELFRNDKSYARLRFFRQDSSEARLTEPPSEDTTQSDSLPKEKKHINEKK